MAYVASFSHWKVTKMSRALFSLCCLLTVGLLVDTNPVQREQLRSATGQPILKPPDGRLHIYVLPTGQGDSHVIQCPTGSLTVIDLGTSDSAGSGYWHVPEVVEFFQGQFLEIRNVILTHNHNDHYNLIPQVFDPATADMRGLGAIFISCTYNELDDSMKTWLAALGFGDWIINLFNNGGPCGPNGITCTPIMICPNDNQIEVTVMAANYGQQCNVSGGNKNIDSPVIKISWGDFSVQLNGDFEDFTSSWSENGPQKAMVDFYGDDMQVTVYKLAHHGASSLANKPVFRDAVRPRGVFVSSNPWYGYEHPRCDVTDAFIQYVGTLCKPEVTVTSDPFYCGPHPIAGLAIEDRLQRVYTCGFSNGTIITTTTNEYAMYSTTPDANTLNTIELVTDGINWGFINNFSPRVGAAQRNSRRTERPVLASASNF